MKLMSIAALAIAIVASPACAAPWQTFNDDDEYYGAVQDDDTRQFQIEVSCDFFYGEAEVMIRSVREPLSAFDGEVGPVTFTVGGESFSTEAFKFFGDGSRMTIHAREMNDPDFIAALRTALSTGERDLTVEFLNRRPTFSGENDNAVFYYMDENC